MKSTILILSFVIFSLTGANVFASCMDGTVSAKPELDAILPANASVIVTLFGTEREAFKKRTQKKLFFISGKHKVQAKQIREWNSEFGLKALQFRASKNLKVGETYSLKINRENFTWKVGEADTTKPEWVSAPTQRGFGVVDFGCGPAVNYSVNLEVSDVSAGTKVKAVSKSGKVSFIKTTSFSDAQLSSAPTFFDVVMKPKVGKKQHFFVTAKDGYTLLGHGMCSGQFVPPRGTKIQVEMTPYDFAGNKGETKLLTLTGQ